MIQSSRFHAGDLVQIRSKEEILATLDQEGRLDGLPFMPEMFEFCGQQLPVFKRAHKTCDPPNGIGGRSMPRAVHLEELRCDGAGHGGCEARCLFFWKDAWLKTVGEGDRTADDASGAQARAVAAGCTEQDVLNAACVEDLSSAEGPTYMCQSTTVPASTQPIRWWDLRQYVEDYASGNVRLSKMIAVFLAYVYHEIVMAGFGLGTISRVAYDAFQRLRGGTPYPWQFGRVPAGTKTPSVQLHLQPGELVRVKPYDEILETITEQGINRGMSFDAEMVPFCGGTYRVLARIRRIVNEKTGKMLELKNECIILEDVVCQACYAAYRRFCPRAIYPYWREIWLERTSGAAPGVGAADGPGASAIRGFGGVAAMSSAPSFSQPLRLMPVEGTNAPRRGGGDAPTPGAR